MRTLPIIIALAVVAACGNTAPTVQSATIEPAAPTTLEDVTVTATGIEDADGDEVELRYAWTVNDAAVTASATLSADHYVKGDVIAVAVTPFDGEDEGEAATDQITVVNVPPTVTSVAIGPQTPTSDDTLTVTADGSDIDDDTLTFTFVWTVDGVDAGSGAELAPPNPKGSVVVATATASDGDATSEPLASASVTTVNAAPTTLAEPTLSATTWYPWVLTCEVPATTDPDGDPIVYQARFVRDGVEYSVVTADEAREATMTVPSSKGEWTCEGRAIDDEAAISPWSTPSTPFQGTCTPGEVTLQATKTMSMVYANGSVWDDQYLRAYTNPDPDAPNQDIVGWMQFDLADGPAIDGLISAELELYVSHARSSPQVVVIQTIAEDWDVGDVTLEDMPREGAIADPRDDLVAEVWDTFPLDLSAWDYKPSPERTLLTMGVDNLNPSYSYAYFGTTSTEGTEPLLNLRVCLAP